MKLENKERFILEQQKRIVIRYFRIVKMDGDQYEEIKQEHTLLLEKIKREAFDWRNASYSTLSLIKSTSFSDEDIRKLISMVIVQ
jgi:hypothetical protein